MIFMFHSHFSLFYPIHERWMHLHSKAFPQHTHTKNNTVLTFGILTIFLALSFYLPCVNVYATDLFVTLVFFSSHSFCNSFIISHSDGLQFYNFIHINPKLESITKEIDCGRIRQLFIGHIKAHF